jgi:hypothetical protein
MLRLPLLSASRLGQLRLTLGVLLLCLIWNEVPDPLPRELHRNYSPFSDNALIHLLASRGDLWGLVLWVCRVSAVLFTLGLFTRTAYCVFVGSVIVARLVTLQSSGGHDWICPIAILLALVFVPWGDGFSLDALRRRPSGEASIAYGFAAWAPGVILGMAFAAAAYSKLHESGMAWITGGAVAYHFIEDARSAPLDWGLWIAAHPPMAVLFSGLAVVSEFAVLPLVLIGRRWSRWLAAGVSLSLFSGFYLFQGASWWPWAIWMVTLLPWTSEFRTGRLPTHQLAAISAIAALQLVAVVTRVEIEPIMSPYPMYSGTYDSPADFEQRRRRKFQRVEARVGGQTHEVVAEASDHLARAVEAVGNRQPIPSEAVGVIRNLCELPGPQPRPSVSVTVERTRLNWTTPTVSFNTSRQEADFPCS